MFQSCSIKTGNIDSENILELMGMMGGSMSQFCITRGLGYGDEGKGSLVDFLTKNNEENEDIENEVIKEGGPQAAHHIVSRQGKLHRSEQIGSGVFNPGVRTFGSRNMLINPANLIMENLMLYKAGVYDGMKRLSIDSRCAIVTPLHQMIGRLLELSRRKNCHGSTGMGVGQAVLDQREKGTKVLCLGDITDETVLKEKIAELFREKFEQADMLVRNNPNNRKLTNLYRYYRESLSAKLLFNSYHGFWLAYPSCIENEGEEYLNDLLSDSERSLVFEGSQGALLDPEFGFRPYVTKTRTTFKTALELLAGRVQRSHIKKIGVVRAYSTRHGAGPFVTEDKELTRMLPDRHNKTNVWQGKFKIGWFDIVAARYGILVNEGIDSIALTNLDRLSQLNNIRVCTSYEYCGDDEGALDNFFEWEHSGSKIRIIGFKKPVLSQHDQISNILFDCKPMGFKKFSGWKKNIGNVKTFEDLPLEAVKYLNFLQSKEGLDELISIVSVGPTSDDKILC